MYNIGEAADGNAYSIMGYVIGCMKKEGCDKKAIDDYISKATSGDYYNLLHVSMVECGVLNKRHEDA